IHHGWRTRMFQLRWMCVVFPCRLSSFFCSFRVRRRVPSCTDAAAYTIPPFLPPLFLSFSFFFFFLRGWVLPGTGFFFSYIAKLSTRPNSKKKKHLFKQKCASRWLDGH